MMSSPCAGRHRPVGNFPFCKCRVRSRAWGGFQSRVLQKREPLPMRESGSVWKRPGADDRPFPTRRSSDLVLQKASKRAFDRTVRQRRRLYTDQQHPVEVHKRGGSYSMQSSSPTGITQANPASESARAGGGLRWLPGPAAILLVLLQLMLIVTVALTAGGTAAVVALVLGGAVLALGWYLGLGSRQGPAIGQVLRQSLGEQIDISPALTRGTDDDDLRAYGDVTKRLREMILAFQHQSIVISLSSAKSRLMAENANHEASGQLELSDQIFQASDETTTALQDVSGRASAITDMNSRNLEVARESSQQLVEARFQVETINNAMGEFQGNIARLEESSGQIRSILGTVRDFSEQTNMLALNAAIEAARAGEHGRGFAVVADEVRNLSARVGEAASQIGNLLEEMINAMSGAGNQAQSIMTQSATAGESVRSAAEQFSTMVEDFTQAHEDLLMVSSSLEELTATNAETHRHASEIRSSGEQIRDGMVGIFDQTDSLRDNTNLVLQALCR